MDRQEFDRGDAERLDVVHHLLAAKTGKSAAQMFRDRRVQLGVAADMGLVDDGAVPGDRRGAFAAPGEGGVDNAGFWHEAGAVALIEGGVVLAHRVAENGVIPFEAADMGLGIGVEAQLVRIEAMARARIVWAVDPIAVSGAGASVRQVAVPHLVGVFREFDPLEFSLAGVVE